MPTPKTPRSILSHEQMIMIREREAQKLYGMGVRESEVFIAFQDGARVKELADRLGMTTGALCTIHNKCKEKVKKVENQERII